MPSSCIHYGLGDFSPDRGTVGHSRRRRIRDAGRPSRPGAHREGGGGAAQMVKGYSIPLTTSTNDPLV